MRLEELVLANSGEDEFEEIFKLVIAKLCAERASMAVRFGKHRSPEQTATAINTLLGDAERIWPGVLGEEIHSRLSPEHLAVCVEALEPHQLSSEGFEVMDSLFEFLISRQAKGAKGQYFTPRHVIELCVRMLKPQLGETILDPACGSGGFLIHALNYIRSSANPSARELADYCKKCIWGVDIDAQAIRVAKALMIISGGSNSNILRANSLLKSRLNPQLLPGLFDESPASQLSIEEIIHKVFTKNKGFDVVLTNPPFAGEVREKELLSTYSLAHGRDRIERDVLFIERCLQFLRPGGRMAIVLPHNKFGAESYSYVREHVAAHARITAVIGLGRNTFLPHTHQKASILVLQKNQLGSQSSKAANIFFAISERDGKDSKGQYILKGHESNSLWNKVDHDFDEVVSAFDTFCVRERRFSKEA
ncbi:HsdM family class I SAM-dependent methyltransferase [Pyxidicoccus trucidator]|uniref:HsdM family class I SAM-dependent methyltransferase n=1 Tax=Pyxidicoccus trucidator TaxID=2709662 RepID=UPI001968273A|nr:N-6 DNA methylase [Pyxidicoccus trucidator]